MLGGRTFLPAYVQENSRDRAGGATQGATGSWLLSDFRASLRDLMEPLGLWDEDSYGIWTILDVGG